MDIILLVAVALLQVVGLTIEQLRETVDAIESALVQQYVDATEGTRLGSARSEELERGALRDSDPEAFAAAVQKSLQARIARRPHVTRSTSRCDWRRSADRHRQRSDAWVSLIICGVRRREFLVSGGKAALGVSALSVADCSNSARSDAPRSDTVLDALTKYWEAGIPLWLAETRMPAVSIALVRGGELAWRRAFGVKDTGTNERVDTNTVFAACSDTKPVFAYGVLKLCEKGVLDLDTPLTKYTKRRVTADPRVELITTRHVLNHTTGFPNWRQGPDLPIEFTPGSKNQYSGEGFSYLQSVVEEITGQSFERFMHENVLTPLGMTSSRVTWDVEYAKRVAKPHDEQGKRLAGKYVVPPTPSERAEGLARYGAAAMLMTTPTDYAAFLLEFLDPKPADAFRPSGASRAEMLRPQVKKGDGSWEGLAWALEQHGDGPTLFTHAGQDAGYYCLTAGAVDRRSGLMVMLNGDAYLPFLMKMLADPTGAPSTPQTIWPEFAKRFFAA